MSAKFTGCCVRAGCSSFRCRVPRWEPTRTVGWASRSRSIRLAKWRNVAGLNCAMNTARATSITGCGISSGETPKSLPGSALAGSAGRLLLFGLPAAGPILAHPLRNLLAFGRVHGLAAPALDRLGHGGQGPGGPLQFLQRGNYAFELLFFGVQVLNRFI